MAIDYDALFGAEDYDPCEALRVLRPALIKQTVEGSVQEIRYRDRTVRFNPNDIEDFRSLVSRLESECQAKNGNAQRSRRAITAGSRPARFYNRFR